MGIPVVVPECRLNYSPASYPQAVLLNAQSTPVFGILAWQWTLTSWPTGSTVATGANGNFNDGIAQMQMPTFNADLPGTYTADVKARNLEGWSFEVAVKIVVETSLVASIAAAQATANEALHVASAVEEATAVRVTWSGNALLSVGNHPGHSTAMALHFPDGNMYTASAPLTINMAVSGRGGILHGLEAVSTWYYVYAVPSLTAGQFSVGVSANAPAVGPTGFTYWVYLGATYNDAAGNLRSFKQVAGANFVWLQYADAYNSGGPVGQDGAVVAFNLAAFIPATAGRTTMLAETQVQAAGTQYEWRFYVGPTLTPYIHLETDPTQASTCIFQFSIPVMTAQTVWRRLVRTGGGANAQYVYAGVLGWEDEWL